MKVSEVLTLGAIGVIGYLLYEVLNRGTDRASSAIASLWLKMFPLPPAIELLGNVKFPGNILVPLQQLANAKAVRQDDDGNVFVNYAGYIWKLAPQVYGNWPATRVD